MHEWNKKPGQNMTKKQIDKNITSYQFKKTPESQF